MNNRHRRVTRLRLQGMKPEERRLYKYFLEVGRGLAKVLSDTKN